MGMHSKQPTNQQRYTELQTSRNEVYGYSVRRRKNRRRLILSNILLVVGIALLIVAAAMWGIAQWRYHESDLENQRLAAYVQLPKLKDADAQDDENGAPVVDWASLKAINDEIVAWIYIPGTSVNYPIYQHSDNEYYLRHSATGEWIIAGQLFLDFENTAPGLVDQQSILYGHHLKNGTMFQNIAALDDQEKFDEVKTIWYVTEDKSYELEPLLLYYTQAEDTNVRNFQFASDDDFHRYLRGLLSKSVTHREDADRIIDGTKHVLTLSTCNYYSGYGRTIFLCVPKEEAVSAQQK